ncbi:bacteriochlorophyll 4-vinyl reductase [Maliponia aquimaris]|uniref:Bacteriochlorophyll 4-vinyl reductase n=1 Tax=Maliponia aquimaris TaxID=1673631 RepID=A0A238KVL9_9RHOB|nr:bacteriochlorophyll 4-vinyl reductase [Maliponia aquimaris]SMX46893.1 hypothetical protein MAA8898_03552 [Maliponia aquimaris]
MPRDLSGEGGARIGPNAILQLVPVLDEEIGVPARMALMAGIGVAVPSGDRMIPEAPAMLLHGEVRARCGARAAGVLARAGRRTGHYILTHRIPDLAQAVLRALPRRLAARMLSRAIAKHAWTFAGSASFHVDGPWRFRITGQPDLSDPARAAWHAAVFETLYRALVHPAARCRATALPDGSLFDLSL